MRLLGACRKHASHVLLPSSLLVPAITTEMSEEHEITQMLPNLLLDSGLHRVVLPGTVGVNRLANAG